MRPSRWKGEWKRLVESLADATNAVVLEEDMAQNLRLPCLSESTSLDYWTSCLFCHVFVQVMRGGGAHALLWDQRHGGKGSNELCSCRFLLYENLALQGKQHFFVLRDNCSAQNKSRWTVAFDGVFSVAKGVHLTVVYMPVGHTKMQPDSFAHSMRCCLRGNNFYTVTEIANALDAAAWTGKARAVELPTGFAKDWQTGLDNLGLHPIAGIQAIRRISYDPTRPGQYNASETVNISGEWVHWTSAVPGEIAAVWSFEHAARPLPEMRHSLSVALRRRARQIPAPHWQYYGLSNAAEADAEETSEWQDFAVSVRDTATPLLTQPQRSPISDSESTSVCSRATRKRRMKEQSHKKPALPKAKAKGNKRNRPGSDSSG